MKSPTRILHILSQRPGLTGSGVYLDAVIRQATRAGFEQCAVVGVPAGDRTFVLGGLPPQSIHPVFFQAEDGPPTLLQTPPCDLDFPIPGMSDVMPYPSSIWSGMSQKQLLDYRDVWRRHLIRVLDQFQPHLVHSNHLWLVSSLLKEIAGTIPVVTTCHATGLRQMVLCPHLAPEVSAGCSQLDHFCVLHQEHQHKIEEKIGVKPGLISIIGVGFRDEVFHPGMMAHEDTDRPTNLLYIGKFSHAKGLPWLLDAFENLHQDNPQLHLHVAGSGAGPEAEDLRLRMKSMGSGVTMHGMLDQENLASLMGRCAITVLPSFYEGVPLVLAEAAACGCTVVATDLPGVTEQLAPILGSLLHLIPLPGLAGIDTPEPDDLPLFVQNISRVVKTALDEKENHCPDLSSLTWRNVFQRIEAVWEHHL